MRKIKFIPKGQLHLSLSVPSCPQTCLDNFHSQLESPPKQKDCFPGASHSLVYKSTPPESLSCDSFHKSITEVGLKHSSFHPIIFYISNTSSYRSSSKSVKGAQSQNSFYFLTFISLFTFTFLYNQACTSHTLATH